MKFDRYNIIARFFPAVICSFPVIIFYYYFLSISLAEFLQAVGKIKWVGNISVSLLFIFLLSQIGRFVGKEIFEKQHFEDESKMPTTEFLMHSNNHYSDDYKKKIHKKILEDFDIRLSTKKEETDNELEARKRIGEAVSLIRDKVEKGRLVFQHNIEYGFVRNLIGGSLIAFFISLINIHFFSFIAPNQTPLIISIFIATIYLLLLIFNKPIILSYARLYAKVLFQEYMGES